MSPLIDYQPVDVQHNQFESQTYTTINDRNAPVNKQIVFKIKRLFSVEHRYTYNWIWN